MDKKAFIQAVAARPVMGDHGSSYYIPLLLREDLEEVGTPVLLKGPDIHVYVYSLEDGMAAIVLPADEDAVFEDVALLL